MSAREDLTRTLIRIQEITTTYAPLARQTAAATRAIVGRHNVGQDNYGNWNVSEGMRTFCTDVTERIRAEVEAEQCRIRDTALARLASELESLRAVLPSLAARAAIEVGVTARAMEAESKGEVP